MNFALIMFLLLVFTGAVGLAEISFFRPRRIANAARSIAQLDTQMAAAGNVGAADMEKAREELKTRMLRLPWWIEYPVSFFPVILVVFLLRSFLVEPFKIPSGSMLPTLLVGDFILVNKYTYGIRVPIINKKIVEMNAPQRGDVMVFRYPENPSLDYIKRVVAVGGDRIEYRDKKLFINNQEIQSKPDGDYNYVEGGLNFVSARKFAERLSGRSYSILQQTDVPSVHLGGVRQFPFKENCVYNDAGFSCTVPPGHYFMMGDNRDSSSDSRYWGFVPDANVVGKAFLIWWNFDELKRIGSSIN